MANYWLDGIKVVPDEDCPKGMVAQRDEDGNLVPLGFITELLEEKQEREESSSG